MKKLPLIASVVFGISFFSQSALADFRGRVGVASSAYELGGDYITAKTAYVPVSLGMTYAADNGFYVDLAISGGTGTHDGWKDLGAPAETFKRSDAALIVGGSKLNQNNGIAYTLYAGLKSGTTTIGAQNTGLARNEETFTSSGLVFGGGISIPIASGSAGAVGVNLGLGLMGANWKDDTGFQVKAKTAVGGSFGVSYAYPITSVFGVVADLKGNSYKYDFGDTATPFNVTEKITTLTATGYMKF